MDFDKVPPGKNPPDDIYVVIEIPANSAPVKYEIDKGSHAVFVDRFMATAMFYPANYGFIPQTLGEDGDPLDVLVVTPHPVVPGSVVRCRPVGVAQRARHGFAKRSAADFQLESDSRFHVRERLQAEAGDGGRHGMARRGEDARPALVILPIDVEIDVEAPRQFARPLEDAPRGVADENIRGGEGPWQNAAREARRDEDALAVRAGAEVAAEIDHLVAREHAAGAGEIFLVFQNLG